MIFKLLTQTQTSNLFRLVSIMLMITSISCELSLLKYYEAQHALAHVIKSVKLNQLQQIDESYEQQCTKSNDCCICNKNFRNSTYIELHMQIHHPIQQPKLQDLMLPQMFDKKLNSQYRFQTCLKILNLIDLKKILERDQNLWSLNQQEQSQHSKDYLISNFTSLNKTEMVDVCTIIAFGAYHKPLWTSWIRGTLIFVFAIVFLVYYSNLFDEINQYYFPKKNKKNRLQSKLTQPNS